MSEQSIPCADPAADDFDFWVGEWNLTWPATQTGGDEGKTGTGINRISKKFGNCVIEENFATLTESSMGTASPFMTPALVCGDRPGWTAEVPIPHSQASTARPRELRTEPVDRGEYVAVNRMVFHDVTSESLKWDWQGSKDGGETWADLWNISYERAS